MTLDISYNQNCYLTLYKHTAEPILMYISKYQRRKSLDIIFLAGRYMTIADVELEFFDSSIVLLMFRRE